MMRLVLAFTAILAGMPLTAAQEASASGASSSETSITSVSPSSAASVTEVATLTTATGSYAPTTTTVRVGANHDYNPDTVIANVGDVIEFIFYPTNHSVVRAAYQYPCIPYNYIEVGGDTFFSGPKISQTGDEQPIWQLTVNDTEPTYFYCSAPGSCISAHMVGVINPNETYTLAAQKAALANVQFQLSPGEPQPAESSIAPTGTVGVTATSPASTSGATNNSGSGSGSSGLSAGAIAGIAIGGAAVLIAVIFLVWFCGRKGGIEKGFRKSTVLHPAPPSMVEANYGEHPKSPPPPTYRDTPSDSHADIFRATSPAQWSQTGSPHNSYAGYPSPPLGSPWSDIHGQSEPPKPTSPAPAELMGSTEHPVSPRGRAEFPA